ncbi:E3 SUMO-protein ligase ZNF451 [Discoglossus pictus]
MESAVSTEDNPISPAQGHHSEDEIEFVSEGPSRPVLECIALSSDDEEQNPYTYRKVKDHVDRQKEKVASTLDRLARHVEVEKRQKQEKNKAFQEKLNFQHAHGLQELEFIKGNPVTDAAKICVNQWLKMPGLKPGFVNSSRRFVPRSSEQRPMNSQPLTCPIMHCNRKFDNGPLLFGHLKRFDHSPCDPTINLHGTPMTSYACVICLQRFASVKEYKDHLAAKAKLADGHESSIPPQIIQCFACPSCYLLFNIRDECLQHMSGTNHFQQAIKIGDDNGTPCPIPIPSYAKKVLIALCKDIPFQVICTSCRHELRSHMELTAHFRTRCRNAGPTAQSEKSIAKVAEIFQVKAICPNCQRGFKSDNHIANHMQRTKHKVKTIRTMEESILAFCYINEGNATPSDFCLSASNSRLKPTLLKRTLDHNDQSNKVLLKRKRESEGSVITNGYPVKKENDIEFTVTAWFCECGLKCSTEQDAEKHIMIANKICHKCLVCGKLADDLPIIHLHMSRFHGGAHLNNFIFWCRACSLEMSRMDSLLAHVSQGHGGHSYYYEQETLDEQPSSSTSVPMQSPSKLLNPEPPSPTSTVSARGNWQCHICEEMFDSEDTVKQHCKSLNTHQFHKYCCAICKKRFHKIETLLRHSQQQHDGDIKVEYFCGLCEDLHFEQEMAFHNHYDAFHSTDYVFVPDQIESPVKHQEYASANSVSNQNRFTCGCLENYTSKRERKEDSSRCLDSLLETGKLWYSCCFCSATGQTYEGFKNHPCKGNEQPSEKDFVVKCSTCTKIFTDAESAQQHYHNKHCFLQKPNIQDNLVPVESKNEIFKFTASGACAESKQIKIKSPGKSRLNYEVKSSLPFASGTVEAPKPISPSRKENTSEEIEIQKMDTGEEGSELPDLDYLRTMTHIVFVDLDNWANFFTRLPGYLNQGTFIWGFQGGKTNWKPPVNCKVFNYLHNTGSFFLHPRCSDRKDAADFAICMHAGRLDEQLPKQIPFTILSGDKGFLELESQFNKTQRPAHILNPHHIEGEMMCALLNSISDTTKDDSSDMETDAVMDQDEDAQLEEAIKRSLTEM